MTDPRNREEQEETFESDKTEGQREQPTQTPSPDEQYHHFGYVANDWNEACR